LLSQLFTVELEDTAAESALGESLKY